VLPQNGNPRRDSSRSEAAWNGNSEKKRLGRALGSMGHAERNTAANGSVGQAAKIPS
jgi:hypothetical protein